MPTLRPSLLLIVAAVALAVLAIIGTATSTGSDLGVSWPTWVAGSLLSYFLSLLLP